MVAAFDKICTERLSLGETTVDDIWYGTEKTQNPNGTDDVYAKLELWKDQLQGAYENLFRIFYHRSCSQTITTIDDTRRVLELADKYCCLSTVSAVLTESTVSANGAFWFIFAPACHDAQCEHQTPIENSFP
jgi:hypothetical protein